MNHGSFGQRLREERRKQGWTQQQLGEKLGKTKNNISQYEKGTRKPSPQTLLTLCGFFGVTVDYLLCQSDQRLQGAPLALKEDKQNLEIPLYRTLSRSTRPLLDAKEYRHLHLPDMPDGSYFYFIAPDDTLSAFRIQKGDLLLVRIQESLRTGDIALFCHDDGPAVLRKYQPLPPSALFIASDPTVEPLLLSLESIHLFGRVTRVSFEL